MSLDNLIESESLRDNAEIQELLSFISYQIENPYENTVNYIKKLKKKTDASSDKSDEVYKAIIEEITDKYAIKLDYEEMLSYNSSTFEAAKCFYKFFVKNARTLTYIFLREYLTNNKVRKNLISAYDIKSSFPKEVYGKKENFILITKLKDIIKDIQGSEIPLEDFIHYIQKTEDQGFIEFIKELDANLVIKTDDIVKAMVKGLRKSDYYGPMLNQLTIDLFSSVINPSLKSIGIDPTETLLMQKDIKPEVNGDDESDSIDDEE